MKNYQKCFFRLAILFALLLVTGCQSRSVPEYIYKINFSNTAHSEERELVRPFYEEGIKIYKNDPAYKRWFDREYFYIDTFDINGDGTDEIFVQPRMMLFCGAKNCQIDILQQQKDGISKGMIHVSAYQDMFVFKEKTNGYNDIGFATNDYQRDKTGWTVWKWSGEIYKSSHFALDKDAFRYMEKQ